MNNSLSQAIIKLFDTERFYAELISNMQRISTDKLWLAGVCVKDTIELHINHINFDVLPLEQRAAVLKHECEHILRDHIARAKEAAPDIYKADQDMIDSIINQQKHKCINMAADMAINGGIPNLPKGAIYAKDFYLTEGRTMEVYLEALKDNAKAKETMDFDGHSLWAESESDKDILKEKIAQAINDAAKKTRAAGKMTNEHELLIGRLNRSKVNWQSILKRFVGRQIDYSTDTSRKKRNRRYGITFPGIVRAEENLHIGVAIDTSGSVPDAAIVQFMAEITKIAKYAKVTVVEADSEIKNAYEFKPKTSYAVKGRGGTAYKPAFDYFTSHSIDAMIYFGDMDTSGEKLERPKYPVLWAIYGEQLPPAEFGVQVKVLIGKSI